MSVNLYGSAIRKDCAIESLFEKRTEVEVVVPFDKHDLCTLAVQLCKAIQERNVVGIDDVIESEPEFKNITEQV